MKYLLFLILLLNVSCASKRAQVLLSSKESEPDWVNSGKVSFVEDGVLYAVGQSSSGPKARTSFLYKISDVNAKKIIAGKIKSLNKYSLSGSETDSEDVGEYNYEVNETTEVELQGVQINERYWKVVNEFDEEGDDKIVKIAYSLVSIELKNIKKSQKKLSQINKEKPKVQRVEQE